MPVISRKEQKIDLRKPYRVGDVQYTDEMRSNLRLLFKYAGNSVINTGFLHNEDGDDNTFNSTTVTLGR